MHVLFYFISTIILRLAMDENDYFTKYIMMIHYNIIESILVLLLIYPYRPRKLPENFNDYIFDDLENMVNLINFLNEFDFVIL